MKNINMKELRTSFYSTKAPAYKLEQDFKDEEGSVEKLSKDD